MSSLPPQLQKVDAPVILAANKVDLWQGTVGEEEQQAILAAYAALGSFHTVLPASAIDGSGLVELVDTVIEQLPEGPKYYPDDWITDHPEQFVMAELIREKVLL